MNNISVLCVDDDRNIVNALKIILNSQGFSVLTALNGNDALSLLGREHVDIAIIDYKMPGISGIELLQRIREMGLDIHVLILTGHGSIPNAVESIRLGAFDYVLKPFHKEDLLHRIHKILQISELQHENIELKSQLRERYKFSNLVGNTPEMIGLFDTIAKVADSDAPVLILGETGTGKEEIAKAIHFSGKRAHRMMNIIDCASINPNLFESELFGHVKGAFTGAIHEKKGLLEVSMEGTIFLDEIADIPAQVQVKLLRAIEERVFRPIGSLHAQKFNARIIAATSKNIKEAIRNREFREDLYYRLNVISLEIPPLRERKDDIPVLVKHFFTKFANENSILKAIPDETMSVLIHYEWPGNVRELENCIERAFVLNAHANLRIQDLPANIILHAKDEDGRENVASGITFSEHEKQIIREAIHAANGNKKQAAETLQIGIATLYRKLKKYGIKQE